MLAYLTETPEEPLPLAEQPPSANEERPAASRDQAAAKQDGAQESALRITRPARALARSLGIDLASLPIRPPDYGSVHPSDGVVLRPGIRFIRFIRFPIRSIIRFVIRFIRFPIRFVIRFPAAQRFCSTARADTPKPCWR